MSSAKTNEQKPAILFLSFLLYTFYFLSLSSYTTSEFQYNLNESGERVHTYLAPDLDRKNIQFLITKYDNNCKIFVDAVYQVEEVPISMS